MFRNTNISANDSEILTVSMPTKNKSSESIVANLVSFSKPNTFCRRDGSLSDFFTSFIFERAAAVYLDVMLKIKINLHLYFVFLSFVFFKI